MIQHVREKFFCRALESITHPLALSHLIAPRRAGLKLLAHILLSPITVRRWRTIIEAACWAQRARKFFNLVRIDKARSG